jgi:futalosine hydrolase
MKILIVSATPFEIGPITTYLQQNFEPLSENHFRKNDFEVTLLITGVGLVQTTYHLSRALFEEKYDLLINAGIAGAINRHLKIGDVVQVVTESFADLGVEESDGSFTSVMELGLIEKDDFPFSEGVLKNAAADAFQFLPKAKGISVNKVHGSSASIQQLKANSQADIESMEGAAFFYAALMSRLPFLQIRSISNYVEPRNKDNWNIPLAIENLNGILKEILNFFTAEAMI